MDNLLKYIIFCIIAILINLSTQRIIMELVFINNYFLALLIGTLFGLVIKFILDKKYIFAYSDSSIKNNSLKFSFYSFNGILTTLLFWGTESVFFFIYKTNFAREFGALIGLTIGYFIKYRLDKNMYSNINMKNLSGWGRFPKFYTKELIPKSESQLFEILTNNKSFIPRGNGRSYGDSAVNKNITINMTKMNKFLNWNQNSGELIAESGVLIADIIQTFLPKGWFPFVTPGTKFVTLGGAIACDVHGKNHHKEGSFGNYVNWIEIVIGNNKIIKCSPSKNSKLFHWTIGGMGLTGIIIRCSIKLKKVESGWISQKNIINKNLDETIKSFYEHEDSTYSVAWIDCFASGNSFGRSILMLGEHVKKNMLDGSSVDLS